MRKTIFFVWLLVISLMAQSNKDKDHTKYFPLSVGSKWEYIWERDGKIMHTIESKVVSKKDGEIFLEEERTIGNIAPIKYVKSYTIKNSMILQTGMAGGFSNSEYHKYLSRTIVLMLPIKIGQEWEYSREDGREINCRVLKWHDEFVTDFGKFKDVFEVLERIDNDGDILHHFIYYAYGIGIVYQEYDQSPSGTGPRFPINVLKSYSIR